jgi:hypothetical protein
MLSPVGFSTAVILITYKNVEMRRNISISGKDVEWGKG